MGLINLKTDLKSLKYGKDRVGGGSSQQPFIQKAIPDGFGAVGNTGGLDVFTRGGSLVFEKTADDTSRLSKLLLTTNTFQGPAFSIKQNVLSRQSVQTQASPKGLNQGPYIPTSTIAQATVSATGLHFNTFGLNPVPGSPGSLVTYSDVVTYGQTPDSNRLIQLSGSFVGIKNPSNILRQYSGGPGAFLGLGTTTIQTPPEQRTGLNGNNTLYWERQKNILRPVNLVNGPRLLNASDKQGLDPYTVGGLNLDNTFFDITYGVNTPSGPGSLVTLNQIRLTPELGTKSNLDWGFNSIYTSQNDLTGSLYFIPASQPALLTPGPDASLLTLVGAGKLQNRTPSYDNQNIPSNLQSYDTIKKYNVQPNGDQKLFGGVNDTNTEPADFRKFVTSTVVKDQAYNSTDFTRNRKYLLGSPGSKAAKTNPLAGRDFINFQKVSTTPTYQNNDLVPFLIKYYSYDGEDQYIQFRAFVTGFSDTYTPDWASFKYLGRGEDFYTYNGFSREISLSFKVHAQSKGEMAGQYNKLNYLASLMTPSYSKAGFMRGNFVEITFGDYLVNTPGIISNLAYSIPDESPWDIARDNNGDLTSDKKLSHLIDVTTFNFKPIHSFVPQVNTPLIAGASLV
jgi:hypothetical protein